MYVTASLMGGWVLDDPMMQSFPQYQHINHGSLSTVVIGCRIMAVLGVTWNRANIAELQ